MARFKGSYMFHKSTWLIALIRVLSVGNVAELKSVTKYELLWYKMKDPIGGMRPTAIQSPKRMIDRALADEIYKTEKFLSTQGDVFRYIFEVGVHG